MNPSELIKQRARYWATHETFHTETRHEIAKLIAENHEKELTDRFYRDLEFGTGGLRGIMGAGTNRMNIYNIRKATTALALYLCKSSDPGAKLRVALSHDSRHFSRDFAMAACEVLAAHNIEAFLTAELRPTPMLSFMVRHFHCAAGICITASHNPAAYNGYKVYWATGAQVIPPHDEAIIEIYNSLDRYEELRTIAFETAKDEGLVRLVGKELDDAYFAKIKTLNLRSDGRSDFKIVYTPLHGSGLYPVTEGLRLFGFNKVLVVPEQSKPDGDFPTVKYPNPEEPEALQMALDLAKKEHADLVLGTDPDTDRIGVIVRENDQFVFFNGNQLGCLLMNYFLEGLTATRRMPEAPLVIKTIVTTDLQADIARHYGAICEETLTGFKWICGLIEDYESGKLKPYRRYVCGGEESYGFLADSFVRDKDAVSACCIAAEMVAFYKSQGKTCSDVLHSLFQHHGLYQESLFTITLPGKEGAEAIKQMMIDLRKHPPVAIDGIPVEKLRDFATSQEYLVNTNGLNPAVKLTLPASDVLQFILTDGTKVSVRPSGTEPKIKFYVSVRDLSAKGASIGDVQRIQVRASERLKRIEQEFVRLAKGS